jgi:hypothetical protein
MHSGPVFIHSLFRAGSTYLFHVFRRSGRYYAYQEALHELPFAARADPALLVVDHGTEKSVLLRHPRLEAGYFEELRRVWPAWRDALTEQAVYDGYFAAPGVDFGAEYFRLLIAAAPGRPVFQECRTGGRIGALKRELGGFHLFLWRNPWDQWWSLKVADYFDAANRLIAGAAGAPAPLRGLLRDLGLVKYEGPGVAGAFEFYRSRPLTAEQSYLLFYTLWCLALEEARQHADLLLNIDRLSESGAYRQEACAALASAQIDGVDFSDCSVPQALYAQSEQLRFRLLEERVHKRLTEAGWTPETVAGALAIRQEFAPSLWHRPLQDGDVVGFVEQQRRARDIAWRYETTAAQAAEAVARQMQSVRAEREAERARAEQQLAERAQEVAALRAEREAERARAEQQLAERAQEVAVLRAEREAERARAEQQLAERAQEVAVLRAEREALRASLSWRVTAPLRWLARPFMESTSRAEAPAAAAVPAALRPLVIAMERVLRDPQRSYRLNQKLLRYPALHGWLVGLSKRAGIYPGQRAVAAQVEIADFARVGAPTFAQADSRDVHESRSESARTPLTGDDRDLDELMRRVECELRQWRQS